MNPVKEYMEHLVSFNEKRPAKLKGFIYLCIEDFVLKNGREFIEKIPFWEDLMTPKECYKNVTEIVIDNENLTYVEGFAQSKGLITTNHAWCCTKEGKVIDPTWKDGEFYYGVPFATKYLIETLLEREKYGILDDWERGYPLLKEGIKKHFLVKI